MATEIQRKLLDEERNEYLVTDKEGNTARYVIYEGLKYYTPNTGTAETVRCRMDKISKFPCRDDDVLLMNYPKCGSHWLANMVSMLLHGNTEYIGTPPFVEKANEQINSLPSPRILLTHLPFKYIPNDVKTNRCRIISMYRNPKDVMVSYYTFTRKLNDKFKWYKGNWNGYVRFYLSNDVINGTWFDHIKMWKPALRDYPDKQVLFLSYEDLKKNLYENILKISNFLGISHSDEFYRKIEHLCTFSNMKEKVNEGRTFDSAWSYAYGNGILPIYRKGEIGDWKNWFTMSQNRQFDAHYETEMRNYDISDIYTPCWS